MKIPSRLLLSLALLGAPGATLATIVVTNSGAAVGDKAVLAAGANVTMTVNAEAGFSPHTATLNDLPLALGTAVNSTQARYFEVTETKTNIATSVVTTNRVRFIINAAGRITTEQGIPAFTPYPLVQDAPAAFADSHLQIIAPAAFPAGMPVPMVGKLLKNGSSTQVRWLNGVVRAEEAPAATLQLRRGWGETVLGPVVATGQPAVMKYSGKLHGLSATAQVSIDPTTTWTTKSGAIATETWAPGSRIDITGNITLSGTLTVGAGTIVRCGSGVQIDVLEGGHLLVNGTLSQPVCFSAGSAILPWGGIWLKADSNKTSGPPGGQLTATGTIFSSYGSNGTWFTTNTGFGTHRTEQCCVLIDNGAIMNLTDSYVIDGHGQAFHSNTGSVNLVRTLVSRATTAGEMNKGQFDATDAGFMNFADRPNAASNLNIDFSPDFVDADDDALYLVPGLDASNNPKVWTLTRCMIGWTKDDGVDTGGSGGGKTVLQSSWIEACFHEAMSHSGAGRIPESRGSVHFACGQGFECGYDGPVSYMDGSAVIGCMVGTRFGDNYTGGFTYGGSLTVKNSLILQNRYYDVWGLAFAAVGGDTTKAWTYNADRMFIENNYLTTANARHPLNTVWNPTTNGSLLAPFMPNPGSAVGARLADLTNTQPLSVFPGKWDVLLSTFSSLPVNVGYQIIGKSAANSSTETVIASGTVNFTSGETIKSFSATLPANHGYKVVLVRLNPAAPAANVAITGSELLYYSAQAAPANQTVIATASPGWSYNATGAEPPNVTVSGTTYTWKDLGYTEPPALWTTNKPAPLGFGVIGATAPTFTPGTGTGTLLQNGGVTITASKTAVYFRKTFTLSNVNQISNLILNIMRDDGAVVYINGFEYGKSNISAGTTVGGVINYSTFASSNVTGDPEGQFNLMPAPPSGLLAGLINGTNVIAVEVHQIDATSSDMVMDMNLTVTYRAVTDIPAYGLGYSRNQPFLYWLNNATHRLEASPDLNTWQGETTTPSPAYLPTDSGAMRMFMRVKQL